MMRERNSPTKYRPTTGTLKSARLSTYRGKFNEKYPGSTPLQDGIYSLLDRGLIPKGSDYTGMIHAQANAFKPSSRPLTSRPFTTNSFPVSRPFTTGGLGRGTRQGFRGLKTPDSMGYLGQEEKMMEPLDPNPTILPLIDLQKSVSLQSIDQESIHEAPTPDIEVPVLITRPITRTTIKPKVEQKTIASYLVQPAIVVVEKKTSFSPHKRFLMSMGQIQTSSESYLAFSKLMIENESAGEWVLDFIVSRIAAFGRKYAGFKRFDKIIEFVSTQPVNLIRMDDHTIISFTTNIEEMDALISKPGQRFKGKNVLESAAIRIQATWRMVILSRLHTDFVKKLRAGEVFQKYYRRRQKSRELRHSRLQRLQGYLEKHQVINAQFANEWDTKFHGTPRTIVHIPSMSFPDLVRSKMENVHTWQIRQLGRLVDLFDPTVSVIYVTQSGSPDVEKYFKAVLGSLFDYQDMIKSKRLVLFPLKKHANYGPGVSLMTQLITSHHALKKLSHFIRDVNAYMVPAFVGDHEIELSAILNLPILGSYQACKDWTFQKQAQRRFIMSTGVPVSPGLDTFTSEQDIYEKMSVLLESHPDVSRWIFKLNGEPDGRGIAYIDTKLLLDKQFSDDDEEPDDADDPTPRISAALPRHGTIDNVLAQNLFKHPLFLKFEKNMRFVKRDVWRSWRHYVIVFLNRGGIVEAAAHENKGSQTTDYILVHTLVDPGSKSTKVIGSAHQIYLEPFKIWGNIFPQVRGDYPTLVSLSKTIGKKLMEGHVWGYVTLEFIAWRQDEESDPEYFCSSIKPHFTENLAQYFFSMLLASGRRGHSDGKLYFNLNSARKLNIRYLSKVPFVDMDKVRRETNTENIDDETDYEERVAIYSNKIMNQNLEMMELRVFNGLCTDSGITFDEKWRLGTQLPVMEDFSRGLCPMIVIAKSPESAIEILLQNLLIISRIMTGTLAAQTNFMDISTYFAKLLEFLRPHYMHRPAVTRGLARLTDLEAFLNRHIALPLARMQGLVIQDKKDGPKAHVKKSVGSGMSSTTISLLNTGIPSKGLAQFYTDFGKEKVDNDTSRYRSPSRVPPGLPMDEYMTIMEKLAGDDSLGLTEDQLKTILEGGTWGVDLTPYRQKLVDLNGSMGSQVSLMMSMAAINTRESKVSLDQSSRFTSRPSLPQKEPLSKFSKGSLAGLSIPKGGNASGPSSARPALPSIKD